MKPDVQRILQKFSKEKENNIEVNLEKVELAARKPAALLKAAKAIDSDIDKAKSKMNKVWIKYEGAYNEWQQALVDASKKADKIYSDIGLTMDALSDLGVDFTQVKELGQAQDVVQRVQDDSKTLKKIYGKPI